MGFLLNLFNDSKIQEIETQYKSAEKNYLKKIEELENEIKDLKEGCASLSRSLEEYYNHKLQDAENKHNSDLATANLEYQKKLRKIKEDYQLSLSLAETDYSQTIENLEASKNKYASLFVRGEHQIHELEKQREEDLRIHSDLKAAFEDLETKLKSNLTAIPYVAGMIADIETYGLEKIALGLSWGSSIKRLDKVKSIRELRKDTLLMVEKNKEAQYQLAYLLELFPSLNDVIECDFSTLPATDLNSLPDHDYVKDYLSKDEYTKLSITERNQLALDRYVQSHNKTNWQIGRDYEQYIGYQYRKKGFTVEDFGSYMGLEDLGRDVIAKKNDLTLIIQCKYWSSVKQIHEKHITQLYGTTICYCLEHNLSKDHVKGVLVTNIRLSETAKKMAAYLGVKYVENYSLGDYPRIKCNIGHGEFGPTKIYHLPFDTQYDITKISKPGEFLAFTVEEAEQAGFRRTYKWHGN